MKRILLIFTVLFSYSTYSQIDGLVQFSFDADTDTFGTTGMMSDRENSSGKAHMKWTDSNSIMTHDDQVGYTNPGSMKIVKTTTDGDKTIYTTRHNSAANGIDTGYTLTAGSGGAEDVNGKF